MLMLIRGFIMYHIFKKTVKSGNKTVQRWYYWFKDENGKQISRVCKNCYTKQQAQIFISQLPQQLQEKFLVSELSKNMFVPGSEFLQLQENLGKKHSPITLRIYNNRLEEIVKDFGSIELTNMSVKKVIDCLAKKEKSATWKNQYIYVLKMIYSYANYNDAHILTPQFPRFVIHQKKSDIFTPDEIRLILNPDFYNHEVFYYLFLLIFGAGLRSGEARAFKPNQLIRDKHSILINGFIDFKNRRTNYNKTGSSENLRWRVVPLPQFVFTKLNEYIEKTGCATDELLFKSIHNKPLDKSSTLKAIQSVVKKANIPVNGRKLTVHSLRYSFVTYLRPFLSGENVQKLAGHANIAMTEYYTRASLEAAFDTIKPLLPVVDKFFKNTTATN